MDAPPALLNLHDNTRSRRDRPCSSCRRRKSRCVLPPDADACVLCTFHKQTCIFGDEASPQPRKRKRTLEQTSGDAGGSSTSKGVIPATRQQHQPPQSVSSSSAITITEEYEPFQTSVLLRTTLGLQHHHYTEYIGPTTIFEPCLYGNAKDKNTSSRNGVLRNVAPSITFSVKADQETHNYGHDIEALDAIEEIVAPHGKALIDIYFRIVHPSFPILDKAVFLEKYARSHREFSPPCLGGVYILASTWWSYSAELSNIPVPDVKALVTLASKSLSDIVHRPKLSSIQGFLLLSQHDGGESWDRTAQMIAISQILGLHLDCSDWDIPEWEKGLRKRLSWAIYMQDIWSALIHGWPAKLSDDNWLVPSIMEKDFEEREAGEAEDEQVSSEIDQGRMVFTQMITLSNIVSGLLKGFYTLRAVKDLSQHPNAAQVVLERAKPIQLKLKEWYVSLPEELRMDNTKDQRLSSTSYLHLAYYAAEITLHRCIIRSLGTSPTPVELTLVRICRDAAKSRFLAVIAFIETLRPEHLRAFWYFCSSSNFALVAAFGTLLCATASDADEVKQYEDLLSKYRWKLRVLQITIMDSAVAILDVSLLQLKTLNAQRLADSENTRGRIV